MPPAWSWAEDSERGAGKRLRQRRGRRRRYSRHSVNESLAANKKYRSGKDRAGSDENRAAPVLDALESLAHLARPPPLFRAETGLCQLRSAGALPQRENFPPHR